MRFTLILMRKGKIIEYSKSAKAFTVRSSFEKNGQGDEDG